MVFCSRRKPFVVWQQSVRPFVISGSCHCGKCICSAEEWYISGEFCDCDDRDCDKHDGLICTGVVLTPSDWSRPHFALKVTDTHHILLWVTGLSCTQGPNSHIKYIKGGGHFSISTIIIIIPRHKRMHPNYMIWRKIPYKVTFPNLHICSFICCKKKTILLTTIPHITWCRD